LNRKSLSIILFSVAWFVITLSPVLFLPLHKFTFYLTVPLVGISIAVSYLLDSNNKRPVTILFFAIWLSLSILTLALTSETNWITKGQETARRVHNYFVKNELALEKYKIIVFYDTEEDKDLPWRPSEVLKVVLSDNNYFKVFWDGKWQALYSGREEPQKLTAIQIWARNFLGY
jgi:preprotein translocase subunit SecG